MKSYTIPNTLAVTSAVVYVLCRLLVGIFPDISFIIAQSWFHGIGIDKSGAWNLTFASFVTGLVSITITAWIIGYIYTRVFKILTR